MTKKKALMYLIIFIAAVSITAVLKHFYLQDPSKNFPDACRPVIAISCQGYINKLTAEKKYDEAVKIQQVRIKENEKILSFFKRKIQNKCLLSMDMKETEETFKGCIGTKAGKRDYFLLKTAEFTIRDIVIDSLAVSEIQLTEKKEPVQAKKTLKNAIKIVKKNKYFFARESSLKELNRQLKQIK